MGRSRSRDKKRSRSRDRKKEKKEKDKRSRSRDRDRKREKDDAPPAAPERSKRSPSLQYRRWRFDSPPKEEDYKRDALITGSAMGMGGVAAALQGGLALGAIPGLSALADTKAIRELYVGNLPSGIAPPQLVQFLNQVAIAVKINVLPGDPVITATLGGGGLFAFVEFRTAEEATNGLRLNNVELLGCQLKITRPKGYADGQAGGQLALPGIAQPGGGLQTGGGMLALAGPAGETAATPQGPQGIAAASAPAGIDHRLCLINLPTFVTEERVKELLGTFGQVKFFALQKDEDGKSTGVAFFEYDNMMTQQQARASLEGLELGAKKLGVKRPEEVIKMGLVSKDQKLGARVVPSKVIYLKNIVSPEELRDDSAYAEICQDIRLEGEKFGPVVSMEVPRPGHGVAGLGAPGGAGNALTAGPAGKGGAVMALEDAGGSGAAAKARAAPAVPDLSMALVVAGSKAKAPVVPTPLAAASSSADGDGIGAGYAFLEFANIEGASKAKKALNGRRFGPNLVVAEYFSEARYHTKDFAKPVPNTDEPVREVGSELVLFGGAGGLGGLDEAPVMVE